MMIKAGIAVFLALGALFLGYKYARNTESSTAGRERKSEMAEDKSSQNRTISGTQLFVTPGKSFSFSESAASATPQRERKLAPEPGRIPRNLPVPEEEVLSGERKP